MPPALLETAHATVAIGDCRKILVLLPENSVDAIVTDPPYGLEFMGKEWDHGTPGVPFWLAALRVLKPGGHLLAFGGTRTFHRLTCALEDAGFEIRDTLSWLYGQGFPKSYNVAQSIEKVLTTGKARRPDVDLGARTRNRWSGDAGGTLIRDTGGQIALTTDAARQWEGWGTALKPAHEPVLVCYKPLTVEQFIAIMAEAIRSLLCQCLPVNDAERSFTDTPARSSEVARSVPEVARTYELANSGDVSFVARHFTCQQPGSGGQKRTPGSSVRRSAKDGGNRKAASAIETLLGRVDGFLSQLTDTFTSGCEADMSASTVSLWNSISDDLLAHASTFTTSTGIRLITALRTLNSLMWQTISGATGSSSLDLSPELTPIVLARKPLSEPTVAANVLRWGTGGLNIDATRITVDPVTDAPQLRTMKRSQRTTDMSGQTWGLSKKDGDEPQVIRPEGRWPANVVLDEEAAAMLDAQSGERTSGYMKPGQQRRTTLGAGGYHGNMPDEATAAGTYGDSGGASRFFYCSKASRTERDAGLEDHNSHPTVKPVTLMRWLVRLVTPPGGTVLDPFCGSGTTLIAAVLEGMETIGIELVEEYCQTAMDRLRYWETQL